MCLLKWGKGAGGKNIAGCVDEHNSVCTKFPGRKVDD